MHLYTPLISFNWTLVMIWATVIVLFFILKKNFFEKVRNFIAIRENEVRDAFGNADLTNKQADERLEDYNKKLSKSENEAREIVRVAKVKADEMAKEIIEKANQQASKNLSLAEIEIEREKRKALTEVKGQIASLALLAAEKIMEKQIDVDGQSEIIDKIIEQAGTTQWQN
ncbi:MAG: F0F1 ATP synthase subunit B [Peptostreptococcaceae bacterium]|nr:F0F1 ATP synthase subunit B [Peptostreptococcaceae bacterium]